MFRIEARPNGIVLTLAGTIGMAEITLWYFQSAKRLSSNSGPFALIIDARNLLPLNGQAQVEFVEGCVLYKKAGMTRSVVITKDDRVARLLQRLAEQSGIATNERYVDAKSTIHWQSAAVAWALHGIEPSVLLAIRPSAGKRQRARPAHSTGHACAPRACWYAHSRLATCTSAAPSRLRRRERYQD
jgi:hypothetical protein